MKAKGITIQKYDDTKLIQRASLALERWCKRTGHLFDAPSLYESEVDDGIVVLRNGSRELARYRLSGERLMKVPHIEKGIPIPRRRA